MKLNIGGIKNEKDNSWITVGLAKSSNVLCNLDEYPLPFENESIGEIYCSHTLEHLKEPMKFLEECYRIMKFGAIMNIIVPHVDAKGGSFGSMEHRWHWHEFAINSITGLKSSIFPYKFQLLETRINRGRFLFWQKREIIWRIKK